MYQTGSKAPIQTRVAAFLIDLILFSFIQSIIIAVKLFPNLKRISSEILVSSVITATVISSGLILLKDIFVGVSIGKWILKIGVREENNPEKVPSYIKLIIRNLLIILWPIEAILLFSKKRKRFGDLITKTDVFIIHK